MMARPDSVKKHVSGLSYRVSSLSGESSMLTFCECALETRVARLSVYLKAAFTAFQGRSLVASDIRVGRRQSGLRLILKAIESCAQYTSLYLIFNKL